MNTIESQFTQLLRAKGYSVTKPRLFIFRLLVGTPPQSMRAIIQKSAGHVDRVSAYRIIELFEQLNIVHRITIGWKYTIELSDTFLKHHHHLSCLGCAKVIHVEDTQAIDTLISALCQTYDFQLTAHQLELQGYCNDCRGAVVVAN